MPAKPKHTRAKPGKPSRKDLNAADVSDVIATLKRMGSQKVLDGMARFAIPTDNAVGIPVGDVRKLAKQLGRNHDLAAALWETGVYEARLLAAFVDDPQLVTAAQMNRWAKDFSNWAVCDTACFHLFDRAPHAWDKIEAWATRREEFVKRAAFALLASLTVHDKQAEDERFLRCLQLIEPASADERNFVKKAVNWALRSIGKRNAALHAAAVAVSVRLAKSPDATPRWIGKDALRELQSDSVTRRLAKKKAPPKTRVTLSNAMAADRS